MNNEYSVAPSTRRDLDEIWSYIAKDNLEAADKLIENLRGKFQLIAKYRLIGSDHPELGPGMKMFPYGSYLIFYLPTTDLVEIVRVLHSARDIPQLFENDLIN